MSYTDPEIPYGKLAAGDAGQIAAAAQPLNDASNSLKTANDSIQQGAKTAKSTWTGAASDAFAQRAESNSTATVQAGERLTTGGQVIQATAQAYTQMRGSADQAIEVWRSRSPMLDEKQLTELANKVNSNLESLRESYEQALRAYAAQLLSIQGAYGEAAKGSGSGMTNLSSATGTDSTSLSGVKIPEIGSSPQEVAKWWDSLTPEQQAELQKTHFAQLGQLRGLPSDVLNNANRERIKADQTQFQSQVNNLDKQIAARAKELGLPANASHEDMRNTNDKALAALLDDRQAAANKLQNSKDAAEKLAEADKQSQAKFGEPARVLAWNPAGPGGDAQMAIAFGDPDKAKNVAVTVPGTGTTVDNLPIDQAINLRAQMDQSGKGNATIQWLGYDAPGWSPDQVGSPSRAEDGGKNLVADVAGYRAAAEAAGNRQHLTVVGHSYGSTTVGYAGMNGLAADDIAFVGSPGVGASNVNQLSPGAGHVYAGATEHDPVVQGTSSDWFTKDGSSTGPYDKSFGAKVFGTTDSTNAIGAHSEYYRENSESLQNLAKIATGNGNEVTSQRWQDSPLPPELPTSDVPVIGPVVDQAANVGKEAVDMAEDVTSGTGKVIGDISRGDWGSAGSNALNTGGEAINDAIDLTLGSIGDKVEAGRDMAESAVDGGKKVLDALNPF